MKILKSILAVMMALLMVLSLAACGDTDEPTGNGFGGFDAIESDLGNFKITVVGAEEVVDIDGKPLLRVYYDYTNNGDESSSAFYDTEFLVTQDDYELTEATCDFDYDVPEQYNSGLSVRPGCTIRCVKETSMKPDGGEITVTITNYDDESKSFDFKLDPANLPGAPAKALEIEPVADPKWTEGLDVEGVYDEDFLVKIVDFELAKNLDDEDMIRINFEFTNNSEEAASPWWGFGSALDVFQDGIELEQDYYFDETESDEAYDVDVEPGKTVSCSVCYTLRSSSPVEVEVVDFFDGPVLGTVFTL